MMRNPNAKLWRGPTRKMTMLHRLAERGDWYNWRPRRFWRWLLARCDRRIGLHNG